MPHDLTTAPTNATLEWPSGYIEALRDAGAQEKTIPYCIRWVRGFFAEYPGRRPRDLGRTEIEAFLRKAAARPNVTNWQVQQARESLEVYHERFRGIALSPRPDVPVAQPGGSSRRAAARSTADDPAEFAFRNPPLTDAPCARYRMLWGGEADCQDFSCRR